MGCGVEASLTITSGVTLPYNIVVPQSKCAAAGVAGDKTEPFSFAEVGEIFVAAFVAVLGCPIVDAGTRKSTAITAAKKTNSRVYFIDIAKPGLDIVIHAGTSPRISHDVLMGL